MRLTAARPSNVPFFIYFLCLSIMLGHVGANMPSIPTKFKNFLTKNLLVSLRDSQSGIVKFNDKNNNLLADAEVREPSVVMLLTANSPSIGCKACKEFRPVFQQTAKTFLERFQSGTDANLSHDDVFFVEMDFSDNPNFFKTLGINNVPHIWIVPNYAATVRILTEDKGMDLLDPALSDPKFFKLATSEHYVYRASEASSPSEFANYISAALRLDFHIDPSVGAQKNSLLSGELDENSVGLIVVVFSVIIIIKKKLNDPHSSFLQKFAKPRVWTGLSVLLIVLFCSGYMFTVVRGVPLLGRNENGPFYFAGGSQFQIGIESFIVAGVYLFIGFWMILLTDILPKAGKPVEEVEVLNNADTESEVEKQGEEAKTSFLASLNEAQQSILVVAAVAGLYYSYSLLTSIYLVKDGGYPFALSRVL